LAISITDSHPFAVLYEQWDDPVTVSNHTHDCVQLMGLAAGALEITTPNASWMVSPNTALLIPPDLPHHVISRSPCQLLVAYLEPEIYDGVPETAEMMSVTPLLAALLQRLTRAEQPVLAQGALDRLISVTVDELHDSPRYPVRLVRPRDERLVPIYEALIENPADPTSLDDWAARFGWSSRTLARSFHQDLGMTFRQYRQHARIVSAIPLLAEGNAPSEVARRVGYQSAGTFAEVFKGVTGRTPRQVQAAERV